METAPRGTARTLQDKMDDEADEQQGEPWLEVLLEHGYDELALEHRIAMLSALCHLVMDSPTIRRAAFPANCARLGHGTAR